MGVTSTKMGNGFGESPWVMCKFFLDRGWGTGPAGPHHSSPLSPEKLLFSRPSGSFLTSCWHPVSLPRNAAASKPCFLCYPPMWEQLPPPSTPGPCSCIWRVVGPWLGWSFLPAGASSLCFPRGAVGESKTTGSEARDCVGICEVL